ncbi:MAG: hypothetical protein KDC87_08380 [Planctomycetes bacterium]|nr:hypothetical protein [Planctomycetota bacterium]
MRTALSLPTALVLLASTLSAQTLVVTPAAVRLGGNLRTQLLSGPANSPYVVYIDVGGGPVRALGVELFLDVSPALTLLDAGTLDQVGVALRNYAVPTRGWPPGAGIFFQAAVANQSAPNGMFDVTDGESAFTYISTAVLEEKFENPANAGFTGTYDRTATGRLLAGVVTRRSVTYVPQGAPFSQPLHNDLNPAGVRIQKVFRAVDLGANGEPEVLTGLWWEAFRGNPVSRDTLARMALDVSHSAVVPDFTIDPFSALPKFPNSGLSQAFANNPSQPAIRVFDGAYVIDSRNASNGFLPYPQLQREFVYDGTSSLLLDFLTYPSPTSSGVNGQQVYLMALSSPRPDARVVRSPSADPSKETLGNRFDNAQTGMVFDFARVFSTATSPWRAAPVASPDYHAPYPGWSLPPGTAIQFEFRGATSNSGAGATAWSSNIDIADGKPYLQYRVLMRAAIDGARPSLDSLVIPIN